MMEVRIEMNAEDLKRLEEKYTTELTQKAFRLIETYTMMIQKEAKSIIDEDGYRDTGRLLVSIKPSLKAYAHKVSGGVNAGTKYARFIHEGAKHEGDDKITSHFVKFSVAPSLLRWAKRHKKIAYIRGDWYFIDKNNQEHRINDINKSGLMVYTKPSKFFEKPFEASKEKFIEDMSALVGGM